MIVDHGRVVAKGTPDELKQQAGRNVIEVHDPGPGRPGQGGRRRLAGLGDGQPQVDEATRRVTVAVAAGTDPLRDALGALDARRARGRRHRAAAARPSTRCSWP